jgi:hypothetical protein
MKNSSVPPYNVACNAGFDAEGVWIITITLSYRDGMPKEGSSMANASRAEAMRALIEVGIRGRSLGATQSRVLFDLGDGVVKEVGPEADTGRFTRN